MRRTSQSPLNLVLIGLMTILGLSACSSPFVGLEQGPAPIAIENSDIPVPVGEASRAISAPSIPEYKIFYKAAAGEAPQAYVWYTSNGSTLTPLGTWASTQNMVAIGGGWFMADLYAKSVPVNQAVGVIIKNQAGVKLSGSADLSRSATGWLRMESGIPRWYATNPEATSSLAPTITLSPQDSVIEGVKTFTVTINDNGSSLLSKSYSVNDTSYVLSAGTFSVDGTTMAPGASVSIMVRAENVNGAKVIGPFVYTKPQGNVTPISLHFKSSWTAAAPTLWLWEGAGTNKTVITGTDRAIMEMEGKTWPGPALVKSSVTDWWVYTIPTKYYPLNNGLKMKLNQGAELSITGAISADKFHNGTGWSDTNPDNVPSVSASPAGGFFTSSTTVTLQAANPANGFYKLGSAAEVAYNAGQTITFGSAMLADESISLVLRSGTGSATQTYTYTKQGTITNGITVKVKGYSKVYYWATLPAGAMATTTWPGVNLPAPDADGWRTFVFPNVTGTNLIFNAPDGTIPGLVTQTPDQSRTTGTWWFSNGQWTNSDPENTPPVIGANPATAVSNTPVSVALSSTLGSDTIYYTLDGSEPSITSTKYTGPITISTSLTLKAKGVNSKGTWGSVYSFSYTVDPNLDLTAPTLGANPAGGSYTTGQIVRFTISDNKAGITAYYTTNGTLPTTATTTKFSTTGTTGNSVDFNVSTRTTFNFLVRDTAGNETRQTIYYNIGAQGKTDFREESIYFLMTTRFYDGDTSNNFYGWDDAQAGNVATADPSWRGDFKGLIEKLDYIKALGFSAIWITPVVKNMSGYDYHGYHAVNHSVVDPRYLSAAVTYQTLIDQAHARGMKVIQDIVLNHTGNFGEENLHPLFAKDANGSYVNWLNPSAHVANSLLEQGAKAVGGATATYATLTPGNQFQARIRALRAPLDVNVNYHNHEFKGGWEQYEVQIGSIAGDCQDLNTENPAVAEYLRNAYIGFINQGVDAFRVDTVKHISRLTFNKEFIPQFKAAGGDNFFIFGEVATRFRNIWNDGKPAISTPFYTWKESTAYAWGDRTTNEASVLAHYNNNLSTSNQPSSDNHLLINNTYRTPDWSRRSGLDVIDFPMHWAFNNIGDAWSTAVGGDWAYSDATFNVTYVDSHDYAPDGAPENQRYTGSWPEKLSLLFTFRGIPTIYYGTEIEFMKGAVIDKGPWIPLNQTGRAYFGDKITGSVSVTGFGKYTNPTGNMATTLAHPLAQHIRALNLIRRAVPALQKGQYSVNDVSGSMAFRRRYTDGNVDSFALVALDGTATFSNVPNGTYRDVVTGATQTVSNGTATLSANGTGNLRVWVLIGGAKQVDPGHVLAGMFPMTYIK